jgi:hypothetical protein
MVYSPFTISDKSKQETLVLYATISHTILALIIIATMFQKLDRVTIVALCVNVVVNWLLSWYIMYVINCVSKAKTQGCKEVMWVIALVRITDMFMAIFLLFTRKY